MFVLADVVALAVLCTAAATTDLYLRPMFELWGHLHWPAVALSESLFPGPYRMHDAIPYGLIAVFLSGALAQAALVGWVIGKVVEMLRKRPHHAL
jgi:hypothetical protein